MQTKDRVTLDVDARPPNCRETQGAFHYPREAHVALQLHRSPHVPHMPRLHRTAELADGPLQLASAMSLPR
jgi:hypothetical protein